MGREGPGRADC